MEDRERNRAERAEMVKRKEESVKRKEERVIKKREREQAEEKEEERKRITPQENVVFLKRVWEEDNREVADYKPQGS